LEIPGTPLRKIRLSLRRFSWKSQSVGKLFVAASGTDLFRLSWKTYEIRKEFSFTPVSKSVTLTESRTSWILSVFEKKTEQITVSLSLFRKYWQVLAGMLTQISLMAAAVDTSILVKVKLSRESGIIFGTNVADCIPSLYLNGDSDISWGDYPKTYNDDSKTTHGKIP
jgi:hypothetical protein